MAAGPCRGKRQFRDPMPGTIVVKRKPLIVDRAIVAMVVDQISRQASQRDLLLECISGCFRRLGRQKKIRVAEFHQLVFLTRNRAASGTSAASAEKQQREKRAGRVHSESQGASTDIAHKTTPNTGWTPLWRELFRAG